MGGQPKLGSSTQVFREEWGFVVWRLTLREYLSRSHNPELQPDRPSLYWYLYVQPGSLSVIGSASSILSESAQVACGGGKLRKLFYTCIEKRQF